MSESNAPGGFRVPRRFYAVVAVFLGVILLGTAIASVLSGSGSSKPAEATDFSSIPATVSFPAPQLALQDLNGQKHSLADYRGKIVLVNLWATWCPPCQAEMPLLQTYFARHEPDGFTVIAIEDGDPTPQVLSFVQKYGLTFPVWLDPTYQATDHAFKTADLPSSYVIDRSGQVRLLWVGAISEANLENYVTPLIQE